MPVTTRFAIVLSAVSTLVIVGVLVLMMHHYTSTIPEDYQQIEARLDLLNRQVIEVKAGVASMDGALHQYASRR